MTERPVILVSNRGPVSFRHEDDGALHARRGSGGLVSGLAPLVEEGRATWLAAALSDADRAAAAAGITEADGLAVRLLGLDPDDQREFYDTIANGTLWFLHHGLFHPTYDPSFDARWWASWEAYRRVNRRFAEEVAELAPTGAAVLVQDYHLCLVAAELSSLRPDLDCVHFHHTPFASPAEITVLPGEVRRTLLDGLAAHVACGFHTDRWADRLVGCIEAEPNRHRGVPVFTAPLGVDTADLDRSAARPETAAAAAGIEEIVGDRRFILRVDRIELSKNLIRGFRAFDELLEHRPEWRGAVTFGAFCYPSRAEMPEYAAYRQAVEHEVARINERWGTTEWTPIVLELSDDYPRSVAALQRFDVLLVNPIRDGLNLVAMEGAWLNRRDGAVLLSTEAGAFAGLADVVDPVEPFDVSGTAAALDAALRRSPSQRATRAAALRTAASARTPTDWLADQLAVLG